MNYLCLVYADEQRVRTLTHDEQVTLAAAAHAWGTRLRTAGQLLAFDTIVPGRDAVAVLLPGGRDFAGDAAPPPFAPHLAAFALLAARDLNDAIRIAARMPHAQLGSIEVRALGTGGER